MLKRNWAVCTSMASSSSVSRSIKSVAIGVIVECNDASEHELRWVGRMPHRVQLACKPVRAGTGLHADDSASSRVNSNQAQINPRPIAG